MFYVLKNQTPLSRMLVLAALYIMISAWGRVGQIKSIGFTMGKPEMMSRFNKQLLYKICSEEEAVIIN